MVELSRSFLVERAPESYTVVATEAECAAVAARLRIVAVDSLRCAFELRRRGGVVNATGVLTAAVVQSCVVTLEPVAQAVSERFEVVFVPSGSETDEDEWDGPDELPYENDRIDLGEATTEQLALALDPYPRVESAAVAEQAPEPAAVPFGKLAALRRAD